jgi:hypothetical protein
MFDPTGNDPSAGKLVGTGSPTLEPKPVSNLLSAFYPGAVSGTEGSVPDVSFRYGVSLSTPNVRGTDPGTMLLVGSCLICLAEIGRKMRKSRK